MIIFLKEGISEKQEIDKQPELEYQNNKIWKNKIFYKKLNLLRIFLRFDWRMGWWKILSLGQISEERRTFCFFSSLFLLQGNINSLKILHGLKCEKLKILHNALKNLHDLIEVHRCSLVKKISLHHISDLQVPTLKRWQQD